MVKDAVPLGRCRRALVVKLKHHGDVLLAAPVLGVLKAHAPEIEVDALVYDETAPMLEGHPALSRLHVVGKKWRALGALERLSRERRLFAALRERHYDLLVHLSEQPRGAWLARALRVRHSVAPALPERGRFWATSFTHLYQRVSHGRRHRVEANLDALRRIGVQPGLGERKVVFIPGEAAKARAEQLVGPEPFIHVHPASRWTFKCWPAERNAQLIDRLAAEGHRVVLTASASRGELDLVSDILARCKSKPVNLAGQLSIKEL